MVCIKRWNPGYPDTVHISFLSQSFGMRCDIAHVWPMGKAEGSGGVRGWATVHMRLRARQGKENLPCAQSVFEAVSTALVTQAAASEIRTLGSKATCPPSSSYQPWERARSWQMNQAEKHSSSSVCLPAHPQQSMLLRAASARAAGGWKGAALDSPCPQDP